MINCLISVVLPIYKEPIEWIEQAIGSILNQTYRNIELVAIIDNPDRNDIREWIETIDDDRIVFAQNDKNLGIVDSLNHGIELSRGEYIARMDADDISLPNRLELQLEYIQNNSCDIIGCETVTFDNRGIVINKGRAPKSVYAMKKYIIAGGGVPHPTWLVKKEVYNALGGYRKIAYAEDYDFLVRAVISGYKVGCLNETCLRYRQNIDGLSQKNKGFQKYVTGIIREQAIKGKVYSEKDINTQIEASQKNIETYTEYYRLSRNIRLQIMDRNIGGIISNVKKFRIVYLRILNGDVIRGLSLKLLKLR